MSALDSGLGPQGLDVAAPADAWTPAETERCCGTCQQLREYRGVLGCHLEPARYVGARWWGTVCERWSANTETPA